MPTNARYYPAMLNLEDRAVVVIGGGVIATRKVAELLASGARVTVISPTVSPRVARWAREGRLRLRRRAYRSGDLKGSRLAVAATSDPGEQTRIAQEAQTTLTWVNVVDQPEHCDFVAPAVVRRGDLTIAVSTGGHNPALARWLKQELAATVGPEYGRLTALLAAVRLALREHGAPMTTRRRLVDQLMAAGLLERVRANDRHGILRLIRRVTGLPTFTAPTPSTRTGRSAHVSTHAAIIR
ncbi:MAG: precorrin-2 dehydrogenase/sirohydrochlorin ferrochelatase family protein [Nitrospirota bacterium]